MEFIIKSRLTVGDERFILTSPQIISLYIVLNGSLITNIEHSKIQSN